MLPPDSKGDFMNYASAIVFLGTALGADLCERRGPRLRAKVRQE